MNTVKDKIHTDSSHNSSSISFILLFENSFSSEGNSLRDGDCLLSGASSVSNPDFCEIDVRVLTEPKNMTHGYYISFKQ